MIEIKNTRYHEMPFSDIDNIRKDIQDGKLILLINSVQLMLYLKPNEKILCFYFEKVAGFANWKFSDRGCFYILELENSNINISTCNYL